MNVPPLETDSDLMQFARALFDRALGETDAARAVREAVEISGDFLRAGGKQFDLRAVRKIYSVALGKAAAKMAGALSEKIGDRLSGGVISAVSKIDLPCVWRTFTGGHPLPNEQSLAAGRAAFDLLEKANEKDSCVIFLVSGGGSAMLEWPSDPRITLRDLQITNEILIGCGATIGEINAVRRRISKVKGGGLSRAARNAAQLTLIVSDTNRGEAFNVASGPTVARENDLPREKILELIERYKLKESLPPIVLAQLEKSSAERAFESNSQNRDTCVLLDNGDALRAVAEALRAVDFTVETADDLTEAPIETGCRTLVERLTNLRAAAPAGKPFALVSGGEFVCPVRGRGRGGRNSEAALRTAVLFDELKKRERFSKTNFAALFGGTDGIDGSSPAAGAICSDRTIARAVKKNLDARAFLAESDSYSFFAALGDAIEIGPTGTNVRDVRILLAN